MNMGTAAGSYWILRNTTVSMPDNRLASTVPDEQWAAFWEPPVVRPEFADAGQRLGPGPITSTTILRDDCRRQGDDLRPERPAYAHGYGVWKAGRPSVKLLRG